MSPDEQKRLTTIAGVVLGMPAAKCSRTDVVRRFVVVHISHHNVLDEFGIDGGRGEKRLEEFVREQVKLGILHGSLVGLGERRTSSRDDDDIGIVLGEMGVKAFTRPRARVEVRGELGDSLSHGGEMLLPVRGRVGFGESIALLGNGR